MKLGEQNHWQARKTTQKTTQPQPITSLLPEGGNASPFFVRFMEASEDWTEDKRCKRIAKHIDELPEMEKYC